MIVAALSLAACENAVNGDAPQSTGPTSPTDLSKRGHARPPDRNLRDRTSDGYDVVYAKAPGRQGPEASRPGQAQAEREQANLVRNPTSPDPENGSYTLEEAVVGLGTDGTLVAEISTELGTMLCDLYADKAPNTVANFVGLARGSRPWWDARSGTWQTRPYFRDTTFHRVIPGYMIQGGDNLGDGSGEVGYVIPDEPHASLQHDREGLLCMANRGPNTNSAQFFITDAPAPQLDRTDPGAPRNAYTIFGRCIPQEIISRIARVPQLPPVAGRPPINRPINPVTINRVLIRRVRGGAAATQVSQPALPPGVTRPPQQRGASPDPSHHH